MNQKIELKFEVFKSNSDATRDLGYNKEYSVFCQGASIKYEYSEIMKEAGAITPDVYSLLVDVGKNISLSLVAAYLYDAIKNKFQNKESLVHDVKIDNVSIDLRDRQKSIKITADQIEMKLKQKRGR